MDRAERWRATGAPAIVSVALINGARVSRISRASLASRLDDELSIRDSLGQPLAIFIILHAEKTRAFFR